ncbi:Phage-related minor tail protein [compost metagenome]
MSSDLRVALRISAETGNSVGNIDRLNGALRDAGREGAKSLADHSWRAQGALVSAGKTGAASFKLTRDAMRQAAQDGAKPLREEAGKAGGAIKQMAANGGGAAKALGGDLQRTQREGLRPIREGADQATGALRRMAQQGGQSLRGMKALAAGVRGEFGRLKGLFGTTTGKLASLGVSVGVGQQIKSSAALDRTLIQTAQTAGMTTAEQEDWRREGFRIARAYSVDRDAVDIGFNTLVASGLPFGAAKLSADAIGQASAVTGSDSAILGRGLVAGGSAFNIDLSQTGAALDLLQKMTVAGRLGNAELENLADIFPKVGSAATSAGMNLAQTLAFVETLSTVELQPERLGTLAESSLRVFSVQQYREQVTKASGVKFYNQDGSSRDPLNVVGDLKRKYDRLSTDEDRGKFFGTVFKGMDQDSVRGWRIMLTGNRLDTWRDQVSKIDQSGPVFEQNLKDNTHSATGTAGRLRATFRDAMDRMAQPLNKAFAEAGSYLLDDLNLSGEQMLGAAVGGSVATYYGGRGLKAIGGKLAGKLVDLLGSGTNPLDLMKNITVGRALEEAAGVTSVFVTNWPSGIGSGGASIGLPEAAGAAGLAGAGWSYLVRGGTAALAFTGTMLASEKLGLLSGGDTPENDQRLAEQALQDRSRSPGERTYWSAFHRHRALTAQQNPGLGFSQLNAAATAGAQSETGLASSGITLEALDQWRNKLNQRLLAGATGGPKGRELLTAVPPAIGPEGQAANAWAAGLNDRLLKNREGGPKGAALLTAGNEPAPPLLNWLAQQSESLPMPSPASPEESRELIRGLQDFANQLGRMLAQPIDIRIHSDTDAITADVERRVGLQGRRG